MAVGMLHPRRHTTEMQTRSGSKALPSCFLVFGVFLTEQFGGAALPQPLRRSFCIAFSSLYGCALDERRRLTSMG